MGDQCTHHPRRPKAPVSNPIQAKPDQSLARHWLPNLTGMDWMARQVGNGLIAMDRNRPSGANAAPRGTLVTAACSLRPLAWPIPRPACLSPEVPLMVRRLTLPLILPRTTCNSPALRPTGWRTCPMVTRSQRTRPTTESPPEGHRNEAGGGWGAEDNRPASPQS